MQGSQGRICSTLSSDHFPGTSLPQEDQLSPCGEAWTTFNCSHCRLCSICQLLSELVIPSCLVLVQYFKLFILTDNAGFTFVAPGAFDGCVIALVSAACSVLSTQAVQPSSNTAHTHSPHTGLLPRPLVPLSYLRWAHAGCRYTIVGTGVFGHGEDTTMVGTQGLGWYPQLVALYRPHPAIFAPQYRSNVVVPPLLVLMNNRGHVLRQFEIYVDGAPFSGAVTGLAVSPNTDGIIFVSAVGQTTSQSRLLAFSRAVVEGAGEGPTLTVTPVAIENDIPASSLGGISLSTITGTKCTLWMTSGGRPDSNAELYGRSFDDNSACGRAGQRLPSGEWRRYILQDHQDVVSSVVFEDRAVRMGPYMALLKCRPQTVLPCRVEIVQWTDDGVTGANSSVRRRHGPGTPRSLPSRGRGVPCQLLVSTALCQWPFPNFPSTGSFPSQSSPMAHMECQAWFCCLSTSTSVLCFGMSVFYLLNEKAVLTLP